MDNMTPITLKDRALANTIKALGTEGFSGEFSKFLRTLSDFDNLIIIVYCGEQNPRVLYRECTDPIVYLPMDEEYLTSAYLLDPFYLEHLKGENSGIKRLLDIAPDQFKRSTYYNIYYEQTTLVDEIAIFAGIGEQTTITACIGKDRSSGVAFSQKNRKALNSFEAVLSSLIEKQWKNYLPETESLNNKGPLSERLREILFHEYEIKLSPRQAQVAILILRGHSSISIGLNLEISPETVKVFRRQLYTKCHISSQAELFSKLMPLFSRLTER